MLLSGRALRNLLLEAKPGIEFRERLIISPILDQESQIAEGSSSIDVRLGQKFQIPKRTKISYLDHLEEIHSEKIEQYKDEDFVPIGDHFVLHPRQFVLGETLEWIHLPHNLSAYVIGRSSWGRDGLVIATATGVHPGYSGILTLEISNIGEIPVYLWPGVTIAQLFIHRVEGTMEGDKDPSGHRGSTGPRSANAASKDRDIIMAFKNID
jgi:dCTP deaminase